jgi:hypothetical protein
MNLDRYFDTDDGSLPEIEVQFPDPAGVQVAFDHLFSCGGVDVSIGGSRIWLTSTDAPRPFKGPEDAGLVVSGAADPFHMVLQGINIAGPVILPLAYSSTQVASRWTIVWGRTGTNRR